MKPTTATQTRTNAANVKLLLVAVALVAAVIIGMAVGDPVSVREASEGAMSWAMGSFG